MRPNARTIYKVLMKNRHEVLWGRRAFIRIRFPMSEVPEPMPSLEFTKEWGKETMGGTWKIENPDGTWTIHQISKFTCGMDPRLWEKKEIPEEEALTHKEIPYLFVEQEEKRDWMKEDDDRSWEAWEGSFGTFDPKESKWLDIQPIDEELVGKYRTFVRWDDQFFNGGEGLGEGLRAFLQRGFWAKTHYVHFAEDRRYLYLVFSVKWFYPSYRHRFATDMKKAFQVAAAAGVDAKLLR